MERAFPASGINVSLMYDQESRRARLLDRMRLSAQQQRLILVGTNQSLDLDLIEEAGQLQFPDHRPISPVVYTREFEKNRSSEHAQGGKSRDGKGRPNNAFAADHVEDQAASVDDGGQDVSIEDHDNAFTEVDDNIDDDNEEELVEDDAGNGDIGDALAEAAQVLTVTKRRLQGITLGRTFSGKPKSFEERKRYSHCAVCGRRDHWKGDSACPQSTKNPNSKGSDQLLLPTDCQEGHDRPALHW